MNINESKNYSLRDNCDNVICLRFDCRLLGKIVSKSEQRVAICLHSSAERQRERLTDCPSKRL